MLVLFGLGVFYEYMRLLPARLDASLRAEDPYRAAKARSGDTVRAPLLPERERSSTPSLIPP